MSFTPSPPDVLCTAWGEGYRGGRKGGYSECAVPTDLSSLDFTAPSLLGAGPRAGEAWLADLFCVGESDRL